MKKILLARFGISACRWRLRFCSCLLMLCCSNWRFFKNLERCEQALFGKSNITNSTNHLFYFSINWAWAQSSFLVPIGLQSPPVNVVFFSPIFFDECVDFSINNFFIKIMSRPSFFFSKATAHRRCGSLRRLALARSGVVSPLSYDLD